MKKGKIIVLLVCLGSVLVMEELPKDQQTETVVFRKEDSVKISRAAFDTTLLYDFEPIVQQFERIRIFIRDTLRNFSDPTYIALLDGQPTEGHSAAYRAAYDHSRIRNCANSIQTQYVSYLCKQKSQYLLLMEELGQIKNTFRQKHRRFLLSIDQLNFKTSNGKRKQKFQKRAAPNKAPAHINEVHEYLQNNWVYERLPNHEKNYIIKVLLLFAYEANLKHEPYNHLLLAFHDHVINKRFDLFGLFTGFVAYKNAQNVNILKSNIKIIREDLRTQGGLILNLARRLNMTLTVVNEHSETLNVLQLGLYTLNATLQHLYSQVEEIQVTSSVTGDLQNVLLKIHTAIVTLEGNVKDIEENLRVMATRKANPVLLPPDKLRALLKRVRNKMKENQRLVLPEDPDKNIWAYYQFMTLNPIILDNCLLVVLTIPLLDTSLQIDLYQAYSLVGLHPKLKVAYQYQLEGEYLGIANKGLYVMLPSARDIEICKATGGYYCFFDEALYPTKGNQWCIYNLYIANHTGIEQYCPVKMQPTYHNQAVNVEGFWWAISTFEPEHVHIRCLLENYPVVVKPPLQMLHVPNGCEGSSSSFYIPAKSELGVEIDDSNFSSYFVPLHYQFDRIDTYHVWSTLNMVTIEDLTESEQERIATDFASIPALPLEQFKQNFKRLQKYTFNLPPTTILGVLITIVIILAVVIACVICLILRKRQVLSQLPNLRKNKIKMGTASLQSGDNQTQMKEVTFSLTNELNDKKVSSSLPPLVIEELDLPAIPAPPLPPAAVHATSNAPSLPKRRRAKGTAMKPITSSILRKATKQLAAEGYKVEL